MRVREMINTFPYYFLNTLLLDLYLSVSAWKIACGGSK